MAATIKVTHFKWTGKYYGEKESILKPEHQRLQGYNLADLFKNNDESVHCYSDVMSMFAPSRDFYHVVAVTYPGAEQKFCNFLLNCTEKGTE
jgi:hypothetical protein